MTESNFPGLEKQQLAHKFFISRLSQLVDEYKKGGISSAVVNGLRHELTDWIKNHVTGLDVEFGIYFTQYRKEMAASSGKTRARQSYLAT